MLWTLIACASDPAPVSAPAGPPPCPADMIAIEGGRAELGRWDPRYFQDQIPPVEIEVERFCVDPLPFPGQAGDYWPEDGLAAGELAAWESLLTGHGRRLCRVEELLWASAYGPANWAFAVGPDRGQACEPDASWGDMDPLGSHPWCRGPYGLYDLNVVSSWARASEAIDDARGIHRRRAALVAGGTNRPDTFYAPDNFGLHAHDPGDPSFFDDQLRVCADPGPPADDSGWMIFREAAALQGTFAGALRWHEANGFDASPLDVLAPPLVFWPR